MPKPPARGHSRPSPRAQRRWLVVWALLTILSAALHHHVWNPPLSGGSSVPMVMESALKLADNVLQLALLPAWAIVWRILGRFQDLPTTLFASALGWGMYVIIASRALAWLHAFLALNTRADASTPAAISKPVTSTLPIAPPDAPSLARRRFLAGITLGAGSGITGLAGATASLVTPWRIDVARYYIPISNLPPSLDGLRIVQISDTHLGPRIPRAHIARALDLAADLRPDLIALTGDYIHMGTWYITPAVEMFASLVRSRVAPLGVFAVLGNHDYYGDAQRTIDELTRAGVTVLDNDRRFISAHPREVTDSAPTEGLCLSGVGDLLEGTIDPEAALRGVPAPMPRLMLAHNPDTSELLAAPLSGPAPRVDLMLSGHTHGGQISIPGYGPPIVPSRHGRRFAYGLIPTTLCPMIVTSGVGMSIMPLRLNVPPEIVEITLRRRA